jgi:hypothetical protein
MMGANAVILPFPLVRRRDMVHRQARRYTELNAAAAERHIEYQVQVQAAAMRRKGVAEDLIERECRSFENAIRELLTRTASGGAK